MFSKLRLAAFMTDCVAAVVAAASKSRGIGANGGLPWRLPGDMAHFKSVTLTPPSPGLTNAVIMGRKTWESIPPKFRPLEGRTNVVLTRRDPEHFNGGEAGAGTPEGVIVARSLKDAADKLRELDGVGDVFVIGGGQVYKEAMESGMVGRVLYTEVEEGSLREGLSEEFDSFFPELGRDEWECRPYGARTDRGGGEGGGGGGAGVEEEKKDGEGVDDGDEEEAEVHTHAKSGIRYRFLEYTRKANAVSPSPPPSKKARVTDEAKAQSDADSVEEGAAVNPEEMQYLDLCRDILDNGIRRGDRTGTGTISKFGTQMRFDLRDGTLPLLTTKRTFWRGVAEELLWFVSGSTNANELSDKDIHIWDGNGSREFLDGRGLTHREEGDLGPVYGFQWRHFGAEYVDMNANYEGKGVDQLAECIDKIRNNPEDRRIIMSAWNSKDLDLMALPPCHMFCQFYVDVDRNELSCQMYQRSADMGLGVPFNIASYALLTHMMAHVTGRKPGEFVHTIGDAHVYSNHVDALRVQLERKPRAFPKLRINKKGGCGIDDFVYGDFEVVGYRPHKTIKMKMAV